MKHPRLGAGLSTRLRAHADAVTIAASAALLLLAAGLAPDLPTAPLLRTYPAPWPVLAAGLAVTFLWVEQAYVNIEVRNQTHSLSLSGTPLVAGLFLVPAPILLAVRVASSIGVLAWHRMEPIKIGYNACAITAETCLLLVVTQSLRSGATSPGAAQAAVVLTLAVTVDALFAAGVQAMIWLHVGPVGRARVFSSLRSAAAVALVTGGFALTTVVLLAHGVLGLGLVTVGVVVLVLAYRGYAIVLKRHETLGLVHDFVTTRTGESLTGLVDQKLDSVRTVLNCGHAELHLAGANDVQVFTLDGEAPLRIDVTEKNPGPASNPQASLPATRRNGWWLRAGGLRDSVTADATDGNGIAVTLTAKNRLGRSTFTPDDLDLLHAFADHLAVELRGVQLLDQLRHDSTHDALTGVHNRAWLNSRLAEACAATKPFTVMLLDLNKFKVLNDQLGHDAGDELLATVASRLAEALSDAGSVTRLGGDEFAVLLPSEGADSENAKWQARRLADAVSAPVRHRDSVIRPQVSIGIAPSKPGLTPSQMLRRADTAMYAAKTLAGHIAVYADEMDRERRAQDDLAADMRRVLEDDPGQFVPYYQPQVDLASGRVVGVEALARWHHPTLGVVSPDRFISLAESSGQIDALTEALVTQALADCARWRQDGNDLKVAVNLSAHTVEDPSLPERVHGWLAIAGIPAEALSIEITESCLIDDPDTVVDVLRRLATAGVTVSLDDFGTGFSSLSYLQRLPVAEIKIDRSFVAGVGGEDARISTLLISAITTLCAGLGITVVAEGIETAIQHEQLRRMGCQTEQGYYVARPMPAPDLLRWLDRRQALAC